MTNLIETTQFEDDLSWCIEKINSHFIARPYWEETTTAYFARDNNTDEQYWKKNQSNSNKTNHRYALNVITLRSL